MEDARNEMRIERDIEIKNIVEKLAEEMHKEKKEMQADCELRMEKQERTHSEYMRELVDEISALKIQMRAVDEEKREIQEQLDLSESRNRRAEEHLASLTQKVKNLESGPGSRASDLQEIYEEQKEKYDDLSRYYKNIVQNLQSELAHKEIEIKGVREQSYLQIQKLKNNPHAHLPQFGTQAETIDHLQKDNEAKDKEIKKLRALVEKLRNDFF